ncbi:MAG: hypothetical protein M3361_14035, partial [Candidatus Tectomicrobia bacterium]|nr:hypothetical protein [Candidatus Tectomicrobia bacterium]
MPATSGWTAAGRLPCCQDMRHTPPGTAAVCRYVPPLIRFAQCCLLLCLAQVLLTRALYANAMPPQQAPQETPFPATFAGPFPVRSLSPIQLLYFQFTPERALTLPRGMWNVRFDLMEANFLARDVHGGDSFLFDFE